MKKEQGHTHERPGKEQLILASQSGWLRIAAKTGMLLILGGLAVYVYYQPQDSWKWKPFMPRDLFHLYMNYIARPRLVYIYYNFYYIYFQNINKFYQCLLQ